MKTGLQTSALALTAAFGATTAGANSAQPTDTWALLDQINVEEIISETQYEVRKSWPAAFDKDMQDTTITGYAVALFATPAGDGRSVQQLILTSDSGLCPMCGSGDHSATLQVILDTPLLDFEDGQRISLKGTLKRVEDPTTWQSAQLVNATLIAQ